VPLENPERSERERIILLSEFSSPMPASLLALLITLGSILRSRLDLQLETLALRHQIGVLEIYESPFTDFSPKGWREFLTQTKWFNWSGYWMISNAGQLRSWKRS